MGRLAARWIGAGLAAVVAAGCAGPTPTLVKDPTQRFDGPGSLKRLRRSAVSRRSLRLCAKPITPLVNLAALP